MNPGKYGEQIIVKNVKNNQLSAVQMTATGSERATRNYAQKEWSCMV